MKPEGSVRCGVCRGRGWLQVKVRGGYGAGPCVNCDSTGLVPAVSWWRPHEPVRDEEQR